MKSTFFANLLALVVVSMCCTTLLFHSAEVLHAEEVFETDNAGPEGYRPASSGAGTTYRLESPLTAGTIPALILQVIDVILVFATPIIVLYIMYGGFQLVTAGGEAGKIEHGRQTIMWALIGGVIILGAQVIISVLQSTVESFMK